MFHMKYLWHFAAATMIVIGGLLTGLAIGNILRE